MNLTENTPHVTSLSHSLLRQSLGRSVSPSSLPFSAASPPTQTRWGRNQGDQIRRRLGLPRLVRRAGTFGWLSLRFPPSLSLSPWFHVSHSLSLSLALCHSLYSPLSRAKFWESSVALSHIGNLNWIFRFVFRKACVMKFFILYDDLDYFNIRSLKYIL